MARWLGFGARLTVFSLVALVLTSGAGLTVAPSSPGVWLDAPLDGTVLASDVGVIRVIGHVTDPGGVDATRFEVDGVVAAEATMGLDPGQLITVEFEWQPATAGPHVLALWARASSGEWVGPAIASVLVEVDEVVTTTTAPTPTSTSAPSTSTSTAPPTATSSTTTAPASTTTSSTTSTSSTTTTSSPTTTSACLFAAPDLVGPADGAVTSLAFVTLSWAYSGCRPALEYQVQVATTRTFIEIVSSATVAATEWVTPNLACNTYWWRVRPKTFDATGPWSAARSFTVSFRGC